MTVVTQRAGKLACLLLALSHLPLLASQETPDKTLNSSGPAQSLYQELRTVGLDKDRIYKVREASLDRAALHISLDDGTIAFTEDVEGRVTGAFFTGFGEVLLSPPNTTERASLAFFTGAAILEEKFSTAYFRFNDDVMAELRPSFRAPVNAEDFFREWDQTARNLAEQDSLRLLLTMYDEQSPAPTSVQSSGERFLHAYVQGEKLGTFDVRYDSLAAEQIFAGQLKRSEGEQYYNVWTSFAIPGAKSKATENQIEEVETPVSSFDIAAVKIAAEVRPPTQLIAKANLSLIGRQGSRRVLLFELSRLLQVSEVRADGHPVEFIHNQAIEGTQLSKRGNDVIAVILPSALRTGQKLDLSFNYSGAVISQAAEGLLYVGERGTWYPNRGLGTALFDMEFRYPSAWTLAATGRRIESHTDGAQQVARWISERPVPLAGFNLGKYSQVVTHAGNLAITTYATSRVEKNLEAAVIAGSNAPDLLPPQTPLPLALPAPLDVPPSPNLQTVGAASARSVEFYQRNFGPFPYPQLAITQIPGNMSQGWPGLIFLSSYSFLSPAEKAKLETDTVRRLMAEQIIAHETAHQWWGDLVSWSGYRDQWISEALANYSALMLLESHDPARFRTILQKYRDDLLAKTHKGGALVDAGPVTLGLRLSSSQVPEGYQAISYGRGTWLFHMLRCMMRDAARPNSPRGQQLADEPFMRALRKLAATYQGRPVSNAELMAIFESELPAGLSYEGHKSLSWFYQGWVNGTSVPEFQLRDVKFSSKGSGTIAAATVIQEHAPDDLVTAVPLYAVVAGKNLFAGRAFAEGHETQIRIPVPAGTHKLLIDPEQTLLSRK